MDVFSNFYNSKMCCIDLYSFIEVIIIIKERTKCYLGFILWKVSKKSKIGSFN